MHSILSINYTTIVTILSNCFFSKIHGVNSTNYILEALIPTANNCRKWYLVVNINNNL